MVKLFIYSGCAEPSLLDLGLSSCTMRASHCSGFSGGAPALGAWTVVAALRL